MPLTKNGYQKIQQDLQTHLHHLLIFFSFLFKRLPHELKSSEIPIAAMLPVRHIRNFWHLEYRDDAIDL